jgi:hypothetical protein
MPGRIVRKTTTTTVEEYSDDGDENLGPQGHVDDDHEEVERDDGAVGASRTPGRMPATPVKPATARSRVRGAG